MSFLMQGEHNSRETKNTDSSSRSQSLGDMLSLNQSDLYACARCSRGFPTSQALGGHQNAHLRERNAKRKQMMEETIAKIQSLAEMAGPVLSPQPLRFVPPVDGQNFPHFAMQLPKQGNDGGDFMGMGAMHGYHQSQDPQQGFTPNYDDVGSYNVPVRVQYHQNHNERSEISCGIPLGHHQAHSHRKLCKQVMPLELDLHLPSEGYYETSFKRGGYFGESSSAVAASDLEGHGSNEDSLELDLTLKL